MARENAIAKRERIVDDGHVVGIRFAYLDGVTKEYRWWNDLSESMMGLLLWHGANAKLGDGFSDAKGNIPLARAAVEAIWDNLCQDMWNRRGVGTDPDLLEAVLVVYAEQHHPDDIRAMFAKWTEDDKKQLAKVPALKAAIAKIKADRAEAKAATDTTLPALPM